MGFVYVCVNEVCIFEVEVYRYFLVVLIIVSISKILKNKIFTVISLFSRNEDCGLTVRTSLINVFGGTNLLVQAFLRINTLLYYCYSPSSVHLKMNKK